MSAGITPIDRSRTISGTQRPVWAPKWMGCSRAPTSGSAASDSTRSLRATRKHEPALGVRARNASRRSNPPASSPATAASRSPSGPAGSCTTTTRASSRTRKRAAIRSSSRGRSVSVASAFPTSFSDSSRRDQRLGRLVEPLVLDCLCPRLVQELLDREAGDRADVVEHATRLPPRRRRVLRRPNRQVAG